MNLFDLACSIVGGLTVVTVSSLLLADRVMKREEREDLQSQALPLQKRRELLVSFREKTRQIWLSEHGARSSKAYARLEKLDNDLAKLDDEELKIAEGKTTSR